MPTAKERILEALEQFGERICDDCLSIIADVAPRQAVNQICHRLAIEGNIERIKGDCKRDKSERPKLVNKLTSPPQSPPEPVNLVKHLPADSVGMNQSTRISNEFGAG
jgi:hypothetical protein